MASGRLARFAALTGAVLGWTSPAFSQGLITTVAGVDWVFPETPLAALQAPIGVVNGMVADRAGNVYMADTENRIVLRLSPEGVVTRYAGHGISGPDSGYGGPATQASFGAVGGLALDPDGNLYIGGSGVIRKVSPDGTLTRWAGTGVEGFSGDGGDVRLARIGYVTALCFDRGGNLFLAEGFNHRVRRINPAGIITSIAGTGLAATTGDGGTATTASVNRPNALVADAEGNLYIGEYLGHRIRKVNPQGLISTIAGTSNPGTAFTNIPALQVSVFNPRYLELDPSGNLYVVDSTGLRKIDRQGILTIFHGESNVQSAVLEPRGSFLVWDLNSARLKRLTVSGSTAAVIAGNSQYRFTGDGGPAVAANFHFTGVSAGLSVSGTGTIFAGSTLDARVRRIDAQGVVATIAGTGEAGFGNTVDPGTPGTRVSAAVTALAAGEQGNVFVSELNFGRLYNVDAQGRVTVLAQPGFLWGLALDRAGNLYGTAATSNGHQVKRIAPNGTVTVIAGSQRPGYSGDGGPAASAILNAPRGIAVDGSGNVYFADRDNHRVRRIDAAGRIETFAGTGEAGSSGDGGDAKLARVGSPSGIAIDSAGRIYVLQAQSVRRVDLNGTITTVAGGGPSYRDGVPATSTSLAGPLAIATDPAGSLYILEGLTGKIRKVLTTAPTFAVAPATLEFSAQAGGAPTDDLQLTVTSAIPDLDFTASSPDAPWLLVSPDNASTPRTVSVRADPAKLTPGVHTATVLLRAPFGSPSELRIAVRLEVGEALPPRLSADRTNMTFTFPRTATARQQSIRVSNAGSGNLDVSVSASTVNGGKWLSASPGQAKVSATNPQTVTVTADPAGLEPGTFSGSIHLNELTVPVVMTVSAREQAILLSQSGLSFVAVAEGGGAPPQNFAVINTGNGTMAWTAAASTLSGGNWLRVSASEGTSSGGTAAASVVEAHVDQVGLAPGRYYGQVRVDAPQAANSPQVATVFLDVLPPGSNPGAVVQPSELVFVTTGEGLPGSRDLFVYNLVSSPITFRSRQKASLRLGPTDGTVQPGQPKRIIVQPSVFRSGAVFATDVSLQFSDGLVRSVPVTVVDGSLGGTAAGKGNPSAAGCAPARLLPTVLTLGQALSAPAGWPAAMALEVRDDCGTPMVRGAVGVSFSNGDPPVVLESLNDGRWHGTWRSRAAATARVILTIEAHNAEAGLRGSRQVEANLSAPRNPPQLSEASVVSLAAPVPYVPAAPGGLIAINGLYLTEGLTEESANPPLRDRLGDSEVFVAGRRLPLLSVSPEEIHALVPYDLETNTRQQLLVRRGTTYSQPVPVNVGPAQPGLFHDSTDGRATAMVVRGTERVPVTPANPARAGETVVLYCAGLGAVTPELRAGEAPAVSTQTANTVQVTIGSTAAKVTFAGLAPGFAGVYEVDVEIPEGIETRPDVPVIIEAAGQRSPPATIAIQ